MGRFIIKTVIIIDFVTRLFASFATKYASAAFGFTFLQEAEKPEQGTKSVIDALSNVLFIYILRHAQQIGLLNQGLLAALQDKRLDQVLEKSCFHLN
mgnify:CR=1 FL=1